MWRLIQWRYACFSPTRRALSNLRQPAVCNLSTEIWFRITTHIPHWLVRYSQFQPDIRQMAAVADNKHQQSGDEVANHYLHSWICISVSVLKILRKIFPHIKAGISQSTKATNEYATFMAGSGIHRLHWSTMHRSILRNHKGINSRIQTFIQATYQEMR